MTAILAQRTQSHIDREVFQIQGYLKLRNILSSSEIGRLRRAMQEAVETIDSSPNGYNVTAAADAFWGHNSANDNIRSKQHDLGALAQAVKASPLPRLIDALPKDRPRGKFILDTSVWRRNPILARFALSGPFPELASQLLGVSRIRFYDDQMFIKEPGAVDRAAFHQDVPYFHLGGDTGCVFWVPLDTVGEGSGRIGYIPGSHLWQKTYKPNIFVSEMPFPGAEGIDMPNIDANPSAYGVQYIDAMPGDVLVHHFLTIHGSEGNRLSHPRRAFSLRYCDAKIPYKRRAGAPEQPLHRKDMRDGDQLDDTIHPIVWKP